MWCRRSLLSLSLTACAAGVTNAETIDREYLAAVIRSLKYECEPPRAVVHAGGGVRILGKLIGAGQLGVPSLHRGDVLLAVDGRPTNDPGEVRKLFQRARGGDLPGTLTVLRREHTFELNLEIVDLGSWVCRRRSGIVSPRIVPAYRQGRLAGWKFVGIGAMSPAGVLGFRTSDLIVAIDGLPVVGVADVLELKEEINAGVGPRQVEIERGGYRHMVEWWW